MEVLLGIGSFVATFGAVLLMVEVLRATEPRVEVLLGGAAIVGAGVSILASA